MSSTRHPSQYSASISFLLFPRCIIVVQLWVAPLPETFHSLHISSHLFDPDRASSVSIHPVIPQKVSINQSGALNMAGCHTDSLRGRNGVIFKFE